MAAKSWSELVNPLTQVCEIDLTTLKARVLNAKKLSTAEQQEALAIKALIQTISPFPTTDPMVQNILTNAGYADLFSGGSSSVAAARRLSTSLKRYLGFFEVNDRVEIEFFNDLVLARIDPTIPHLNVFKGEDFQNYIALAKQAPVDANGVLLPAQFANAARLKELLNEYANTISFSLTSFLTKTHQKGVYLEELLKEYPEDSEKIREEMQVLARVIEEAQRDYATLTLVLFKEVPSADFGTSERLGRRMAMAESARAINNSLVQLQKETLEKFIRGENATFTISNVEAAPAPVAAEIPPSAPNPVTTLDDIADVFGPMKKMSDLMNTYKRLLSKHFPVSGSQTAFLSSNTAQISLAYLSRGLMKEGNAKLKEALSKISDLTMRKAVYDGVANASRDQALAWVTTQIHYSNGSDLGFPLEQIMIHNAGSSSLKVEYKNFPQKVPFLNFRIQQVVTARSVLRYGNLNPKSNILEVGYGTPTILAAIKPYLGSGKAVGLDVMAPPAGYERDLPSVTLLQGNGPLQSASSVKSLGPYSVIYGLDVFKTNVGFGESFKPGVSHAEYLKWIHENLEEGGVFIATNDYETPLIFSEEELEQAGLHRVRVGITEGTENERVLLPGHGNVPREGRLNIYVYRKGAYDMSKLGTMKDD